MRGKTTPLLLILLLFLALFALRFVRLGADPPSEVSISMGYMSDPGGYVHNARNKVLFDRWKIDNWNQMHITPIPHYLTYLIFRLFGPGIAQMNVVPALFACLTLLFFYLTLKPLFGRPWAALGTALLGVNFIFTIFSQVAVRAMPMLFFTTLALYLLTRPGLDRRWAYALAGAAAFLSFTAKGTFLFVLPALILGVMLHAWFGGKRRWKAAVTSGAYFAFGLGAVLLLWLLAVYLPHRGDFLPFGHSNLFWLTPHDGTESLAAFMWEVLKNFWHRPLYFFLNMPVIAVLSSLSLTSLAYRFFSNPRKVPLATWAAGLWVISNMVWFAIIQYRPGRHLFPLVVPVAWLAVQALVDFSRLDALRRPSRRPLLFFVFLYGWMFLAISGAVILFARPTRPEPMYARLYFGLGAALAATAAIYLIFRLWPSERSIVLPAKLKTAAIFSLVGASLVINLVPFGQWAAGARYDRRTISRDLGRVLPSARLGGLVSMVLALENRHPAHAYKTDYINRGLDFIDRYDITHLLISRHAEELKDYQKDFPQHMRNRRLLARYPLWRTYVELYDIRSRPESGDGPRTFEGETFFSRGGLPRSDPEASGGLAFRGERNREGYLIDLAAGDFSHGEYAAVFRMRSEASAPAGERIARLEVVHEEQRRVLGRLDLNGRDLPHSGAYREIELPFTLKKDRPLTLRVYLTGLTEIRLDRVVIISLPRQAKKNPPG